jgi:hypothetical protein
MHSRSFLYFERLFITIRHDEEWIALAKPLLWRIAQLDQQNYIYFTPEFRVNCACSAETEQGVAKRGNLSHGEVG